MFIRKNGAVTTTQGGGDADKEELSGEENC